jgi:hypothetical protein
MTHTPDNADKLPEPFAGSLRVIDLPFLRAYIQDISRWVIGEAVGGQLPPEQCDELAGEIAAILATGLAPALSEEIVRNTEKVIADSQDGPVSFDWQGRMTVGGFTVPDLVRLLDAVGQLIDHGVGDALDMLHDSHRRALSAAHGAWSAKHDENEEE